MKERIDSPYLENKKEKLDKIIAKLKNIINKKIKWTKKFRWFKKIGKKEKRKSLHNKM